MAQNMMVAKTQLYLVLELAGSEPTVERYGALFDPQIVPSLLIVPEHDRKPDAAALQAFVAVAQHHDVAVLIADDVELAAETGADGVHLSATSGDDLLIERYRAARESLGANAIIGGDAGFSRHDAMALGEAGANYVAFSPPHRPCGRSVDQPRRRPARHGIVVGRHFRNSCRRPRRRR